MDAHTTQAIRKKYSAALMSNHKWRKFFTVMAEKFPGFRGIEYRFTDTASVYVGSAPSSTQIWQSAVDDPVEEVGGPIEYKHIESITIPRVFKSRAYENAPYTEVEQPVGEFLEELRKVGSFPISKQENTVVVRGYE